MLFYNQKILFIISTSIGISLFGGDVSFSSQTNTVSLKYLTDHKIDRSYLHDKIVNRKEDYFARGLILSQSNKSDEKQLIKDQKNLEKEIRKEEKDMEKESKKSCDISGNSQNEKQKKCEPSVYEQALPGLNFETTNNEVTDEITKELQKELKDKNQKNIIVK
jgi:hypothetical protein